MKNKYRLLFAATFIGCSFTTVTLAEASKITLVNQCPSSAHFKLINGEYLPDLNSEFDLAAGASIDSKIIFDKKDPQNHASMRIECLNIDKDKKDIPSQVDRRKTGFFGISQDGLHTYNWTGVSATYNKASSVLTFCFTTKFKENGNKCD